MSQDDVKIVIGKQLCGQCGLCVGVCPAMALALHAWGLEVDQIRCTGCRNCVTVCPSGALQICETNYKQTMTTPQSPP